MQPVSGLSEYRTALSARVAHPGPSSLVDRCYSGVSDRGPSCHSMLFHGKLSEPCIARRQLTVAELPCVGKLLITGYPGSGTLTTTVRLRKKGFITAHEFHALESDQLVSWLSRTDVWRLGRNFTAGPAFDSTALRQFYGITRPLVDLHITGMGRVMRLSRCLYRRVLLQTREPLATIRSSLFTWARNRAWDVMADQLFARSDATSLAVCDLPVAPPSRRRVDLNSTRSRRPIISYALHRYWLWMSAAAAASDAHFAVERELNISRVCAVLGGLDPAMCYAPDGKPVGSSQHEGNQHATKSIKRITWLEACAANKQAAIRVYQLARTFGYRYAERGQTCVSGL